MGARRRCRCSSLVLHDGSGMEPNGGWWKIKLCCHIVCTASCPTMAKKQTSSNISVLFRNHVWHRHKSMNLCITLHQPFHLTTPTWTCSTVAYGHILFPHEWHGSWPPSLCTLWWKKTGFSHSYKPSLWIVRVHYFRYLFSLGWTHVFFPVQKHVENRDTNCDKTIMKYGQCISTFQILVYQHSCQHHGTTSKMKEHLHGFHLKHIYSIVLVVHEWTTSNYIIKTVLCVLNPSMFQSIAKDPFLSLKSFFKVTSWILRTPGLPTTP